MPCANGKSCAQGEVCDELHHGCITPDQLTACDGLADGADCNANNVTGGGCFDGVCLPRGCGNGVIEPGEACDDHNVISHDGCRDDCRSTEVCGNGVLDEGEDCDDGNSISRDGCDSRCIAEQGAWTLVPIAPQFVTTGDGAFDEARHRYVLLDQYEAWEWDGTLWTRSAFQLNALVDGVYYDTDAARVVAFTTTGTDSQLYAWSGTAWTQISSGVGPVTAQLYAIAYFPLLHQPVVVMSDQTVWTLDDVGAWKRMPSSVSVTSRSVAAYDASQGRLIVVQSGPPATEFAFDGVNWTSQVQSFGTAGSMAFDRSRGHLMLVEKDSNATNQIVHERVNGTWSSTGTVPCNDYAQPPGALYYDNAAATLVRFTGDGSNVCALEAGLWSQSAPKLPFAPTELVADPSTQRFVITQSVPDSWAWGGSWQHVGATQLANTISQRATYDPQRHAPIIVGIIGDGTLEAAMLTAAGWVAVPAPSQVAVGYPLVTYDPALTGVVVFDGNVSMLLGATDVWTVIAIPPHIFPTDLAYDARANALVATSQLPGGNAMYELHADWDRTQLAPIGIATITTDARSGGIVAIGFDGGWQRVGDAWTQLPAFGESLFVTRAAYDPATGRIAVLASTQGNGSVVAVFERTSPTPLESCNPGEDVDGDGLAGCDDPDCFWACSTCVPYASCP